MYSLPAYGQMVGDPVRFAAYRDALSRAVFPGAKVLDLGAGPGVFSLLAARAGAAKVYAVETDGTVEWLRPLARENGVADRVEILRGLSTELRPPEPVDVLISDLRGVLPFFGRALPSVIDARNRWLKPGGRLIARRDVLWIAPVEAPREYERQTGGFTNRGFREEPPLDLSILAHAASNHWSRVELEPSALSAEPAFLGKLDYATVEAAHFEGRAEHRFERSGLCHGLAAWFDAEVDEQASFSNRPSTDGPLYGQAFFPWSRPVPVTAGECWRIRFDARLVGEDYVFRWRRKGAADPEHRWAEDQSTFHGAPLGQEDVREARRGD